MLDRTQRLEMLLGRYGSDISLWPADTMAFGRAAMREPELNALLEREKRFEQMLHTRNMPQVPGDLSQRIIAAAFARPQMARTWFREVLAEVRPAALAATLVLGFAIGFGMMPAGHNSSALVVQSTSDDDGVIL